MILVRPKESQHSWYWRKSTRGWEKSCPCGVVLTATRDEEGHTNKVCQVEGVEVSRSQYGVVGPCLVPESCRVVFEAGGGL